MSTRLIASKSMVSPLKKHSIPHLELMAAQLLAELVNTIKTTLSDEIGDKLISTLYWVDSLAALCWIWNDKVWKQFVRHRVSDILLFSSPEEWFFFQKSIPQIYL